MVEILDVDNPSTELYTEWGEPSLRKRMLIVDWLMHGEFIGIIFTWVWTLLKFLQVSFVTFLVLWVSYQNIRYMLSQPILLLKIELPYLSSTKDSVLMIMPNFAVSL
jgi:hypothetical protein